MQLVLPVTREWTCEPVTAAISASDIPRGRVLLIVDAPGCEGWAPGLEAAGFEVQTHRTGKEAPPADPIASRARHAQVRRLSQALCDDGPLLLLEDDGLVPRNVYAALTRARRGNRAATGVQVSRHGTLRAWGVWTGARTMTENESDTADGAGCYCLLCDAADYRLPFPDHGAVDLAQTRQMAPIGVAWDCRVGHLTPSGIIEAAAHVYHEDGRRTTMKGTRVENTASGPVYRTTARVIGDGMVLAGERQLIPIEQAREWAQRGFIADPALIATLETKPAEPRTGTKRKRTDRPKG